jgi:hypothetical protein
MKFASWVVGACILTGPCFGQSAEFFFQAGASRISNAELGGFVSSATGAAESLSLKNGWRIGVRTALNNWRYFGHEFGYGYNRTQLKYEVAGTQQGMAIHQGFYNFMAYGTREGSKFRPFVSGGVHFNNYVPPGSSATSGGGNTKFGINYGGGLKVRVGPIFAIRFDLHQYTNPKPFADALQGRTGWLRQTEISAGFGFVI